MSFPPLFRSGAVLLTIAVLLFNPRTSRAVDEAKPWINVREFGAKGDCRRVLDGAMNKGSTTFSSAQAFFTKADIGRPIYVLQAGAQKVGDLGEVLGAPLTSRIVSIIDGSTATLADAARQDVARTPACWGTDDTLAIQQAIDSLAETGGTVYVPPGLYRVTYQGGPGLKVAVSNIRLCGSGTASGIFNSSVLFKAKEKAGKIITEQGGVPAIYAGSPAKPVRNVEIDHLWLGDNGQNYSYRDWGAHGWGVLGAAGRIDDLHFHDLTIETGFLCGVNMDSETKGFSIHHVTVLSSGEHGFYLAGTGSDGDVHDNRILGTTSPMRQGMAIKKKTRLRITHNELANVDFQGICVVGDSADHQSHDVLIADNWLHDLSAWHTEGIVVSNATETIIRNNRIEDTNWIGISLRTSLRTISNVTIKDNVITRAGRMNPCFAISVRYDPPPKAGTTDPQGGKVSDIVVEDNVVIDCPSGVLFSGISGNNLLRRNRVERRAAAETGHSYKIAAAADGITAFTNNTSANQSRADISSGVTSQGNTLD